MEHGRIIVEEFNVALGLDPADPAYDDKLENLYETNTHAKLATLLNMALYMTIKAQQTFEAFAIHAYGTVPDKVERWTQTGQDYRKRKSGSTEEA